MPKGISPIPPDMLTMAEAAVIADMPYDSFRRYRVRGVVPEPDGYVGRTPWWRRETIEKWAAVRPRRGGRR